MYRVVNRRKRRRRWWSWKTPKPKVDERFCEKCRQLYQDGPMPEPVTTFHTNSVESHVLPAGTWRRKDLAIAVGRWKAQRRSLYLSQYFSPDELQDLEDVVRQTREAFERGALAKDSLPKRRRIQ